MIDILENSNNLTQLSWVKSLNDAAVKINEFEPETILEKTVYLNQDKAKDILNLIQTTNGKLFHGKGLELGAGAGLFSSTISKIEDVDKIFSLEIIPNFVKLLQPKIIKKYGDEKKIIPTLGSFENLNYFPENYFDFIFEYDAFHHADNLSKVLNECNRVLKKDGKIICIDRIQADRISNEMIERKLNIKYPKEYFDFHCKDFIEGYTRRDNGEHEIRRSEWILLFKNINFKNIKITNYINYSIKAFVKLILSYLPDSILKKTRFKYLVGENILSYIDGFFRDNKPSNQGKFINLREKKIYKDLAVLICEK